MIPSAGPSQKENNPGSPTAGEPDFLVIGKLVKPHGISGEIVMEIYTDFPERIQPGEVFYIGGGYLPHKLVNRRPHARGLIVKFEGYHDRDKVGELRNKIVYVRTADRPPLEQGEYYHHQLIGMQVMDETGNLLGRVERILSTGANDVYVVDEPGGGEILIPAIDSIMVGIDLEAGILQVQLLPGMRPED